MMEKLQNTLYHSLNELFSLAAVDEMAGDTAAYMKKLEKISQIADILGVDTEITTIRINIKDDKEND